MKKKKAPKASAAAVELERARALSRMIAGFVHQFRTPLHIISSTGAMLADTPQMPEALKPELELLRRSADRLSESVSHLLAFAKGDPMPWTERSLNEPLNKVIDFLKDECRKRHVRLDLTEDPSLPPVRMQSALLEEAILNFAMNSLEAMPKGGILSLATQAVENGKVRICINDTGVGMDAQAIKKLGQAFTSGKKAGMGLGVYFAFEILKRHKARAQFESAPGQWTIATLTFPTAAAA
jgi:signal transduction histidine kinase